MGILDAAICGLLVYDVVFFYYNSTSFLRTAMFFFSLVLALIYYNMRRYLYVMMVTFSLSLPKLFKNAFIFALINWKRNLAATLGTAAVIALCGYLSFVFLPIGAAALLFILFSTCAFIGTYAAWPKIRSVMIDPYYQKNEEAPADER